VIRRPDLNRPLKLAQTHPRSFSWGSQRRGRKVWKSAWPQGLLLAQMGALDLLHSATRWRIGARRRWRRKRFLRVAGSNLADGRKPVVAQWVEQQSASDLFPAVTYLPISCCTAQRPSLYDRSRRFGVGADGGAGSGFIAHNEVVGGSNPPVWRKSHVAQSGRAPSASDFPHRVF
jgi:hypothetical protein